MRLILSIQSPFSNSSSSSRKFLRKQLLSRGFHVEEGFFCEYHWIPRKSLRTKLFQRSSDPVSYCLNTKIKRDCNSIQNILSIKILLWLRIYVTEIHIHTFWWSWVDRPHYIDNSTIRRNMVKQKLSVDSAHWIGLKTFFQALLILDFVAFVKGETLLGRHFSAGGVLSVSPVVPAPAVPWTNGGHGWI